jgi:hypothetical protein
MRLTALALSSALGFAMAVVSAHAAPAIPAPVASDALDIIQVAGGCGAGSHRNYRGYCARNYPRPYAYQRRYYRPFSYYRPYGNYEPWNRPSPSDYIANRLNAQQLYRGPWGY